MSGKLGWVVGVLGLVIGCSSSDGDGDGAACNPLFGDCEGAVDTGPHPCDAVVEESCTDQSDASCESEALTSCATDAYLRGYAESTLPPCDSTRADPLIDAELWLSLYRYSGVSDAATVNHTQALQAYYAPNQLTMYTDDVARADVIRYAIDGDMASLNAALIDTGIPADATTLTPEQEEIAVQAIGRVMFEPTREFFERYAIPAAPKVNVAVIDQIISPSMVEILEMDGVVVGLGLSPTLLDLVSAEESGASLNTMLEIDSDFTPTLFVGNTDIVDYGVNFQHVVAHEMGHALGLPHVEDVGNLMEQGGDVTCRHWLSTEQVAAMGPFSEVTLLPDEALARLLARRSVALGKVLAERAR